MSRFLSLLYGVACYAVFFLTFLYAVGFVADLMVPKSIDSGPQVPIQAALIVNLLLMSAFAIQHSVMARNGLHQNRAFLRAHVRRRSSVSPHSTVFFSF